MFPAIDRRRARSGAHFRASYDALLRGERRLSAAQLLSAFQSYPFAVLNPEVGRLGFAALRFRLRQRALWKLGRQDAREWAREHRRHSV